MLRTLYGQTLPTALLTWQSICFGGKFSSPKITKHYCILIIPINPQTVCSTQETGNEGCLSRAKRWVFRKEVTMKRRWNASPKSCFRLNDCRIEGRNKKQPMLWLHQCPKWGGSFTIFLGVWYWNKKIGCCGSKCTIFPKKWVFENVCGGTANESKSCVFFTCILSSHIQFRRNLQRTKKRPRTFQRGLFWACC